MLLKRKTVRQDREKRGKKEKPFKGTCSKEGPKLDVVWVVFLSSGGGSWYPETVAHPRSVEQLCLGLLWTV